MKNAHNIRKVWMILLLFLLFSTTLGFLIGKLFDAGLAGAMIMLILASSYAVFAYFASDKLILRSLKAQRIDKHQNTHLYQKIHDLAARADLPPPELYYIADSAMNILSLGRSEKQAKIIFTTGLIDRLSSPEAEAVFAHELAHIKAFDNAVGGVTTIVIGIFPYYAELLRRKSKLFLPLVLTLSFFSPLSALLMHLALSPKREFEADAAGILITRYPHGLFSALEKLGTQPHTLKNVLHSTAHLWIVSPLRVTTGTLMVTHPKLEERLKILQSM